MSDIQQAVREKYGAIAASVARASKNPGCCGPAACGCDDPITSHLYSDAETTDLPADAVTASLGCGNPTATVEPWRVYDHVDAPGKFASAFVRADKPAARH